MAQAVIPKTSPEAICLGGGLLVGDLSEILVINDNNILSGVPNYISSPTNLRYVAKKTREATFMSIAGSVCNYPCSMSCDKVERDGIDHLVKDIYLWGG